MPTAPTSGLWNCSPKVRSCGKSSCCWRTTSARCQTALDQTLAETSRLSSHRERERLDCRAGAPGAAGHQLGGCRERARHAGDRARRGQRAPSIRSLCDESAARGAAFACRHRGKIARRGAPDACRAHRGHQGVGAQGGGSDDRTQLHGKGCRAAHRRPRWARRQDPRARADAGVADGTIEHPGGDAEARETALAHAEQKIKSLTDRIAEIEVDAGAYRAKTERRIDELNASLQRERVELAVAQGALETTRRDYAR